MLIPSHTTVLLGLLALLSMADVGSANLCSATRAPGGSKSNSGSQQAKECDVDTICTCSYTTTSSMAPSTSSSSSSAAPSTSAFSSSVSTSSSAASSSPACMCGATTSVASSMASSTSSSASPSSSSSTSAASTGTTPVSMANEPCPCVLIQELLNMKYLYLSYSQQLVFEVCLNEIRSILVDVSISMQKKVSKIALSLKNHFKKYPDIKKLLKFKKIANWGRVYSLLDAGISFDSVYVDSLITIDATGECNMTKAITSGTANDACGAGSSSAIAAVLGRVKKMFKKQIPGYHKGRKMGYFKKAMVKYLFVMNPSIESCVRNVSVPGFGNVDQFLSLCDQYETSSSLSTLLLNGTATDNAVFQSLNNSLNSNATVNSTDAATLSEAMNYVNNLTVYFTSTSDVVLRLKFLSAQFSMLSSACRVLLHPIDIVGTVLTVDFTDIISSSHFCDNNGCGNITAGSPSMIYPENTLVDTVYNISDIEEACQTFNATLTPIQALSFKTSTYNGIQNCVRGTTFNNQPLTDMYSRYSCAVYYVSNYATNQPTLRANFLSVELYSVLKETSTTISFSNVGGFCGCS